MSPVSPRARPPASPFPTPLRKPSPTAQAQGKGVQERLSRAVPHPHLELKFETPWQLLIATILAAQSTDKTINRLMPELLARCPDCHSLAKAEQLEIEVLVKTSGFFRNKAKAIRETSIMLVARFDGEVPRTMVELLELPGVARKTANVVLGSAHGVAAGIVVDTHGIRVSQRLRLTKQKTPEKIEADLCALFPQGDWMKMGHRLTLHGRHLCTAKKPDCPRCPLNELCPSREAEPEKTWTARAQAEAREMDSRAEGFVRPT